MQIIGLDGMTSERLQYELQRGGKFVYYEYCISLLIVTLRRSSDVYFVRAGASAVPRILGFSAISLFLGWWGIPWGPIYTVATIAANLGGGKVVTKEVVGVLSARAS